jgi:tetratricopeptide (TPR) repeat protein
VLHLDPEDLRSVDALVNLYLKAQRWQDLLEVYSKKADLVADAEEKKLIYYEVGAVYERELGNVQSSIDTYQKVLELDPDDLTALGRLDVLYQTAANWSDLLTVLMHEAELTADPAEAISFQYRIAELFEKHLDDVARAVSSPRHPSAARSRRPCPPEGVKGGTKGAAGGCRRPRARLRVDGRVGKARQRARGAGALVARSSRASIFCTASRRLTKTASAMPARRSIRTRAVAEDTQNEESLGAPERLAIATERWLIAVLYDRAARQAGRSAGAVRRARAGASHRFMRCSSRAPTARWRATGVCSRSIRRTERREVAPIAFTQTER